LDESGSPAISRIAVRKRDDVGEDGYPGSMRAGFIRETAESLGFFGATRRIRTDDLLITNQLLYRLS
jgi:hypothetical protein